MAIISGLDNLPLTLAFDEFETPADFYFLSHCHADHLKGLGPDWNGTSLYTNYENKTLLKELLQFPMEKIRVIENPLQIPLFNGKSLSISTLEANHCFGAIMFYLYWGKGGKNSALYTGDFRANQNLWDWALEHQGLGHLFYDDTFEGKSVEFPDQEESVMEVIEIIRRFPGKKIYLGTYNVGKEKIIQKIFEVLGKKTYFPFSKKGLLAARGLTPFITHQKGRSQIMGYHRNFFEKHGDSIESDSVVILPTGIQMEIKLPTPWVYQVRYSEHSDSEELQKFISALSPLHLYPLFKTEMVSSTAKKPIPIDLSPAAAL